MAHHELNGKMYADTAFLNALHGIPGVSVEHMGFGEFYVDTPKGRVEFDRMRGKDFPGVSGRSHSVYDDEHGSGATAWLIEEVERRGKSTRVARDEDLRAEVIRLAASRPEFRDRLLPLLATPKVASTSRYCGVWKASNGSWYMDLAPFEYGEYSDADTYGPFPSMRAAEKFLDRFSNPGGWDEDDSGSRPPPTESPNGSKVKRPGGSGTSPFSSFGRYASR